MRNTKDWYLFVDRLVTEQKQLYIYIERKFYTADDASDYRYQGDFGRRLQS